MGQNKIIILYQQTEWVSVEFCQSPKGQFSGLRDMLPVWRVASLPRNSGSRAQDILSNEQTNQCSFPWEASGWTVVILWSLCPTEMVQHQEAGKLCFQEPHQECADVQGPWMPRMCRCSGPMVDCLSWKRHLLRKMALELHHLVKNFPLHPSFLPSPHRG